MRIRRPRQQATSILVRVWRAQPPQAVYFFLAFRRVGHWYHHVIDRNDLERAACLIDEFGHGADVYWCAHGFTRPCRRKRYAVPSPWLWSDLDASDPRDLEVEPTIAIETSPGRFHAWWEVDAAPTQDERSRFNRLVRGDGGGGCLTKYLRLPGTRNYKYRGSPRVRLMWENGPVHRLHDVRRHLPLERRNRPSVPCNGPRRPMPRHVALILASEPKFRNVSQQLYSLIYPPLMRAGWSNTEIGVAVQGAAQGWNKFRGRSGPGAWTLAVDIAESRRKMIERGEIS